MDGVCKRHTATHLVGWNTGLLTTVLTWMLSSRFIQLSTLHIPALSWNIQDQSTWSTYCPALLRAVVNFYIPYIKPISDSPFWHHCAPNYFFSIQGITCIIDDVCFSTPKRKCGPNLFSRGVKLHNIKVTDVHPSLTQMQSCIFHWNMPVKKSRPEIVQGLCQLHGCIYSSAC